jgi:hypothetical protein
VRKYVPGEVDVFQVKPSHELYGHMNVNYLKLDALPRFDAGWRPVLDALRGGRFFVTTGEVLIPSFAVGGRASGETLRREGPVRKAGPGRPRLPGGALCETSGETMRSGGPATRSRPRLPGGALREGQPADRATTAVTARVEWTFPPSFAEVVWGDGTNVHRHRTDLSAERGFGGTDLRVDVALTAARWVRLEVWDVAGNGAFTQPVWID